MSRSQRAPICHAVALGAGAGSGSAKSLSGSQVSYESGLYHTWMSTLAWWCATVRKYSDSGGFSDEDASDMGSDDVLRTCVA